MTGPERLTLRRIVEIVGEVIGWPLRYQEIRRAVREVMLTAGPSEQVAEAVLSMQHRAIRHPAAVASGRAAILARSPRSFTR